MTSWQFSLPALIGFGVSSVVAFGLVCTQPYHYTYTADTTAGPHKLHTISTTRVGGFSLIIGLSGALWWLPLPARYWFMMTLLAALPVLIAGLAEDISKNISSWTRLIASLLSAVLLVVITGIHLTRLDLAIIDGWLTGPWFWWPLTVLAIASCANAFNIIDGLNGLATGLGLVIATAIVLLAFMHNDSLTAIIGLLIIGVFAGFFIINFPLGRLFLGDGGAYLIGFLLAALGLTLIWRSINISPFALLLLFSYPATELTFSIIRRTLQSNTRFDKPDRWHFHSMLYRYVFARFYHGHAKKSLHANSTSSILLWSFSLPPALIAVSFAQHTWIMVSNILTFVGCYCGLYYYFRQQVNSLSLP